MNPQSPIAGLRMDQRPLQQPENSYPFAKNGVLFDLKGASVNEEGFKLMQAAVPYQLNGIIETDHKPLLFSTDDTYSAIGYFNPNTELYEPIVDDSLLPYKLGFKKDNFITGQSQRNYKNETVAAFTDAFTFPKYFNADRLQVTRLEDWNLHPYYRAPSITVTVSEGGILAPGTYYIAVKYFRNDGTTSPYSPVTLGRTVSSADGSAQTDKALTIEILNADSSYDFVVPAIISKVKGITTAVELDPYPINTGGQTIVTYTGDNLSQPISLEEILVPPSVYTKIGCMGQLNDALYIANLEIEPEINDMQPYANLINISWKSELMDATNPPQSHVTGEKKSFMHEEVYALYVRYRTVKGAVSRCFTIPGLSTIPVNLLPSTETNGQFTGRVFQVEDIITIFDAGAKTGRPGVYQNMTEKYPDTADFDSTALGGRNLRNKPVLHHKMPSIRWCKENLYAAETSYGKNQLDLLGLIATNIQIPNKYIGIIDGYEILYAKRTISNMTNYGQGILYHGSVAERDLSKTTGTCDIFTTGANWNSRVRHRRSGSSYDEGNNLHLRLDTMRFHAFDILTNKPGIRPAYISAQLKHRLTGLRALSLYQDGSISGAAAPTVNLLDYTVFPNTITVPAPGNRARALKDGGFYLTQNLNLNRFVNIAHETCFAAQLKGPNWPLTPGMMGYATQNIGNQGSINDVFNDEIEAYVVNLKDIKDNVYSNFYSQSVIKAGNLKNLNDSSAFFGGDIFLSDFTFHTYGRHDSSDVWGGITDGSHNGKKVVHRFVCESTSNIALRFEIPGNIYSQFHPRTILVRGDNNSYPEPFDRYKDPNQWGYTKDLNALNDLIVTSIFSPFREIISKFPFRIHRGGKASRQSKFRSWRSFLPLDYYEMQKNMGLPIHLEGMDDKLLIHMENALFLTQDKAKLESGLLGVTLGAGDIFQFEPQEGVSAKLGYAGTQHQLACVRTPVGYAFVDSKQGEIFLFKGSLDNIGDGISRFLREYLKVPGINPFTGNGVTIGWDQKYKRIMLTVKKEEPEGAKLFEDTLAFWANIQVGDIVFWNNRYIRYTG